MFNRTNIRSRVLAHVESRIRAGQEEYDEGAERENDSLLESIKSLQDACKRNKQVLEDKIISGIIS